MIDYRTVKFALLRYLYDCNEIPLTKRYKATEFLMIGFYKEQLTRLIDANTSLNDIQYVFVTDIIQKPEVNSNITFPNFY